MTAAWVAPAAAGFWAAAALSATAAPAPSGWRTLEPGLEWRIEEGGSGCRKGSPRVALARIDPSKWRLDIHHVSTEPGEPGGLDAAEWRKKTSAAIAINAGQYYPDRRPMGLFVREGRNLGTDRIRAWKGILAAEPAGPAAAGAPRATIIDLDFDPFDEKSTPYRVLLQSFMLLDREGKKRVRRSDWHANRTVVASDRSGRLIVAVTEGAWTLWELADWLAREKDLGIRHALSLDGGFESQMSVRAGGLKYESVGQWHVDDRGDHSIPGLRVKLPAVVTISARK